jgi:hypothetical protein
VSVVLGAAPPPSAGARSVEQFKPLVAVDQFLPGLAPAEGCLDVMARFEKLGGEPLEVGARLDKLGAVVGGAHERPQNRLRAHSAPMAERPASAVSAKSLTM